MFNLFLKITYRNKWNLFKIYFLVPFSQILPIIVLSNFLVPKYNDKILYGMMVWGGFYSTLFEIMNSRIERFNSNKVADVFLSGNSILKYNSYEILAINFIFVPSNILIALFLSKIFEVEISMKIIFLLFILLTINNLICGIFILSLQLVFKNYFNKVNLLMDLLYLISGVVIPLTTYPIFLQILSLMFPITNIIQYLYSQDWKYLLFYIMSAIFSVFIGKLLFQKSLKKYRLRGNIN
ncbi:hypothetical protein BG262_03565 [Floricoccus penangensis]|uniref:ABC-2 type transporter domain-containing protein n=1 Tax=Floricoccus penangensis TaxID=1859475 RepID=A0A9Q5NZY2_9LACT|nr:hypothetical protein [Floricoccus penangensis]OFI46882.1 hypothetical protein BG262_03565 [Floricoccus penangensis]